MRIAIITPTWGAPWSEGVRNLARRLVIHLRETGDDVIVIHPKLSSATGETSRNPSLARQVVHGIAFVNNARRRLREAGCEVGVWFTSLSSWYGVKQRLLTPSRVPVVPFVTGLRAHTRGYRFLSLSTPTVVISPYLKERLLPHAVFIPPYRPVTVQRPVDFERTPPGALRNILFLGAFEKERGVEVLIDALRLMDDSFHLTIAWNGVGAKRQPSIQRRIASYDLVERVHLLREIDVNEAYARADVIVIPRVSCTRMAFPVRILEAAHMRLPLIVSDILGMGTLVGSAGKAVPPGDERALADALSSLLTDQAAYATAIDGCKQLEQVYSGRAALASLREVLQDAAKGRQ
jgi:glycosyltransferase involved in cell wall biosynthesis